jgi:hypothetical protein
MTRKAIAMSDKEEKKAQRDADAKVAWDEYQAQQAAIEKNTQRLRKLRLEKEAREAASAAAPKAKRTGRK